VDSAGSNDLSITGALWKAGRLGGALWFDGSDDRAITGSPTGLEMDYVTMAAWVWPDEITGSYQFVFNRKKTYSGTYTLFMDTDDTWATRVRREGAETAADIVASDDTATAQVWTHLAATYDGSDLKLFINGDQQREVDSVAGTIDEDYDTNPLVGVNYKAKAHRVSPLKRAKLLGVGRYDHLEHPC